MYQTGQHYRELRNVLHRWIILKKPAPANNLYRLPTTTTFSLHHNKSNQRIQTSCAISTANLNNRKYSVFLWVSNNIKQHYSQIFTLWNFHRPPWHLKLFKTFTTSSPPPFLLVFMPVSQQESLVCYCMQVNKVCLYFSGALYLYLGNWGASSTFLYVAKRQIYYIIPWTQTPGADPHTHLTPMLFLDLSHPTKTDDAHFIILHSSIHISVNLCRELNWPWLVYNARFAFCDLTLSYEKL